MSPVPDLLSTLTFVGEQTFRWIVAKIKEKWAEHIATKPHYKAVRARVALQPGGGRLVADVEREVVGEDAHVRPTVSAQEIRRAFEQGEEVRSQPLLVFALLITLSAVDACMEDELRRIRRGVLARPGEQAVLVPLGRPPESGPQTSCSLSCTICRGSPMIIRSDTQRSVLWPWSAEELARSVEE